MPSISDENEVEKRWRERINSLDNNDNFSPYRSNDTNSPIISQIQSINKVTECDIIQEFINKNENELIDLKNKFNKCSNINKESVKTRVRGSIRGRRRGRRGRRTRISKVASTRGTSKKSITESRINNTTGGKRKTKTNKNKQKQTKTNKNKQKQTKT